VIPENLKYRNITTNSRDVKKGDLFVAVKGNNFDGHDFIDEAFKKGAIKAVVENEKFKSKNVIVVKDTRKTLSMIAAKFYDNPSKELNVIGITGTNGKTTTSLLIDKIFSDAGFKTGLIGTIFYRIDRKKFSSDMTTPGALRVNKFLRMMADAGCAYAILEISSHALEQERVKDVGLDVAIFTNLTREHLDYHRDLDGYFGAKTKIFNNLKKGGIAVLNVDDPRVATLKKKIKGKVLTYGYQSGADVRATGIIADINGSSFRVLTSAGRIRISTKLIGCHNISNILAAISTALILNIDLEDAANSIRLFKNAPGRLEAVCMGQDFSVFVDYAHTDDALKNVVSALRKYSTNRLITVFGCGGDRDRTKRPRMGKIAARASDYTIITSDNPRSENPLLIAKEIEKGIKAISSEYSIVLDRKQAINRALNMANKGDIVLVAGKGHEEVQIVGSKRSNFSDRETIMKLLKKRKSF